MCFVQVAVYAVADFTRCLAIFVVFAQYVLSEEAGK